MFFRFQVRRIPYARIKIAVANLSVSDSIGLKSSGVWAQYGRLELEFHPTIARNSGESEAPKIVTKVIRGVMILVPARNPNSLKCCTTIFRDTCGKKPCTSTEAFSLNQPGPLCPAKHAGYHVWQHSASPSPR